MNGHSNSDDVAFLGPEGTFSEQAARDFFPSSFKFIPRPTIQGVFKSVVSQEITHGIVPFENSSGGRVHQTIIELSEGSCLVTGQLYLKISHNLVSKSNQPLSSLKKVYSHPQGLAQCQNFLLANCPQAVPVPVSSTAKAAELASEDNEAAGISSISAASKYNLQTLRADIQDESNNTTRFFAIGSELPIPSGKDETLIAFGVGHSPGQLAKCLLVFAFHKINLSSLDSFPNRQDQSKYQFFVQVQGHSDQEPLKGAIKDLSDVTTTHRIVGCVST